MKGALKLLLQVAGSLLFSTGCHSPENNHQRDTTKILSSPAYASITDSIKRFPGNASLYLQRAGMLSQNNLHEIANADYKKSWELTYDESIALEYISNLLLVDKIPEAIDVLKDCIKRFPKNTEFSRRLGEVYAQTGEATKALEQYDSIVSKDSSNFETWYDKGLLLVQLRDTLGAIAAWERSFAVLPINYSGMALANLYTSLKNPRALQICDILLSKDSGRQETDPVYMKGVYYEETRQFAKALEQFEECIRRDWKMTDAYIEKGIVLFEQKKYEEALKVFTMAATVSNTSPDAYYWMGRCYEATGKKEEAITNYGRAIALDRSFIEAKVALKRMNRQ